MIQQLFKFLMICGIMLGLIFMVYTNLSKQRKDKSIIYLNLFVLFFTLNNLQITIADYDFVVLTFYERKLLLPFYVLIIPAFYTFVVHYLKAEQKIKSFVSISVVLFLSEFAVRVAFFSIDLGKNANYIVAKYAQIEEIVNLCYTIFLFLKVVYIFLNQSKLYENVASYDNMKWLKKFLIYGFLIIVLWVFAISFNLQQVISPNIPVYYPLRLSSSFLIYWIAYHGFFKYNLLIERVELRAEIAKETPTTGKIFEVAVLNDLDFLSVQNYIILNKKYLIADYSVESLALEINISERKLSVMLQKNTNFGFSDYINFLRVQKAKKYLTSKKYAQYTITSIGLECGFNSKSTFYRAFTKHAGVTPTEYKQQNA